MYWVTKKNPNKIPGYFLCTIEWGENRVVHEYYWGPDKKGRYRWWTSETVCQLNIIDGGFSDRNFKIVAWSKMPDPLRKGDDKYFYISRRKQRRTARNSNAVAP